MKKDKIIVSPSILSADFSCLREEIKSVENAGADELHLDIMDGQFVPNISFGPVVVKAVRSLTSLPLSAHLMIVRPSNYIEDFINSGCSSISFHVESEGAPEEVIKKIKKMGADAGIVINPDTSYREVSEYLPEVNHVLVMSVYPGFSGQEFIPDVLNKIMSIRKNYPSLDIAVDGGINDRTAGTVIEAGANILISASYIFSSPDRAEAIRKLRGNNE